MTPAQFAALRQLTRWPDDSPAAEACRLVLCEGLTQADAARATGAHRQAVHRALARAREVQAAALVLAAPAPAA